MEGDQGHEGGTVTRTIQDDTLPGGPREKVITYHAPFDCPNREADYAEAWAFFEREGASEPWSGEKPSCVE